MNYISLKNIIFLSVVSTYINGIMSSSIKYKRQLFRENLHPQFGGKIPDSALYPERLSLNKLNQNGIYTSTGVYLEQQHINLNIPKTLYTETFKINLPSNYNNVVSSDNIKVPLIIDTTYLMRQPVNYKIHPPKHRSLPLIPYHSLELTRKFKGFKQDNSWNEIFPPNGFPNDILADLEPYLKKLHEVDYD